MHQHGDDGEAWSVDRVEALLIDAFRALPSHPVFSDKARVRAIAGTDDLHAEALSWASRFVGQRQDALALLTWARCRAGGQSVRERYAAMGWPRASAERARQRALRRIVACLPNEHVGLDSETNRPGASPSREAEADLEPA